jgi:hypothetical protein
MEGSRPRGAFVAGRARKVLEAGGVAEVGARPAQVDDPNLQLIGGRRQRVPFFSDLDRIPEMPLRGGS